MTDHFESCYRMKCKLLGIFSVSSDMGVGTHVEDKECSAGGADQVNHYGKSLSCFLSLWIGTSGKDQVRKGSFEEASYDMLSSC